MARNRQRAKERQAARRAARQSTGGAPGAVPEAQVRADAPPEELGRSDYTLEHTVEEEEFVGDLQVAEPGEPEVAGPRGVRGGREREEEPEHRERGRVTGFLAASWAELNRVQWPDRSQLTSLTGITLVFVLIVGGYLGLLDAVFSKLVQAIL